jgi:hypothetical protein
VYVTETGSGIQLPGSVSSPARFFLFVGPSDHGKLLVRGSRLNDASRLGFAQPAELTDPGTPPDPGRSPVATDLQMDFEHTGTGTIDGHLVATFDRLHLPAGAGAAEGFPPLTGTGWRLFSWTQPPPGPGCYAYQVDGSSFSKVVVVDK